MNRFEKLTELTRGKYDNGDPGHDFAHIQRVIASCRRLGAAVQAELEILLPAALLHDVVNIPKNHPDRTTASRQAATEAAGVLRSVGYSEDEIARIQVVITEHSYSLGKKPSCIESAVLQDADRLDALGAIGLMRMVSCGGRLGSSYYNVEQKFANERALDDKKYTLDHLEVKLYKLPSLMNTEAGRAEAFARAEFMKVFVQQLENEIG